MTEVLDASLTRRDVMRASAWGAPSIVLAVGVPAGIVSDIVPLTPPPAGVIVVRAGGPAWQSYTEQNLMPGFRFSATSPVTATLVIAKTGVTATASDVLYPYDAMVFTGNSNVFTATTVPLDPSKTKGVTIKNTPLAIGTYVATIYYPAGSNTVIGSAQLTISQGSNGKLAVAAP